MRLPDELSGQVNLPCARIDRWYVDQAGLPGRNLPMPRRSGEDLLKSRLFIKSNDQTGMQSEFLINGTERLLIPTHSMKNFRFGIVS